MVNDIFSQDKKIRNTEIEIFCKIMNIIFIVTPEQYNAYNAYLIVYVCALYIYIYIYIYVCVCVCVCIYSVLH